MMMKDCKYKVNLGGVLSGCSHPEILGNGPCDKRCPEYNEEDMPDVTDMDDIKAKFHEYKAKMIKSMQKANKEKQELEAEIVELQNENRRLSRHRVPHEIKSEIISLCTKIIDEVNE